MNGIKGYETVEGLAPDGARVREFLISKSKINHFQEYGPEHKFYELLSVIETLKQPILIAEGLGREGYENALCYIGKPNRFGDGWNAPPHPNAVLLVCMTHDFKIFEWRWDKEDAVAPNYPVNVPQRFTKIRWKRS